MARIRIRVSRHSAFYSPLIAAIAGGFLESEGLEAHYETAVPGRGVPDGLRDGSVDVGQLAVSASWGPMEQGRPNECLHFAQINERDGFFLTARAADEDFSWQRLAGREVLVDHLEQPYAMFRYAVEKAGVDFASLRVIDAGDVDAIDAAFRAGRGDYVHQQGPAAQQLEHEGLGRVAAAVGEVWGPVAFSSLVAARTWLASDAARRFMSAYRCARRHVAEQPARDIARAEADFFPGTHLDALTRAIERYQRLGCWNPDPRITREAYEAALDVFLAAGRITRRHPYEAVVVAPPDED